MARDSGGVDQVVDAAAGQLLVERAARLQAEAKYNVLVDQIPAIVYLDPIDRERASISVSGRVKELLGIDPETWLSDPHAWARHVHPEDIDRAWFEYFDAVERSVPLSHEYRMVHEDGSVRWVMELTQPVLDEEGAPWLTQGVIFDITARRLAEEGQAARSERMASIIETQRDISMTELDVVAVMRWICQRTQELTDAEAAAIVFVDDESAEIRAGTGFMEGKVRTRFRSEGSLPGWVYRNDRSAIQVDALSDPRSGPLAREMGFGSVVLVQLSHAAEAAIQLIVISREPNRFTEEDLETLELLAVVLGSALSHAAEFESKRQQVDALARFETVFRSAVTGITLLSPEGRFLDANPAFELMSGYTKAELASMTPLDISHPDDLARVGALLGELHDGTRDSCDLETRFHRKDGQLLWGHVVVALRRDRDGEPPFMFAMIEDITKRREAEAEVVFHAYHDDLTGLTSRARFEEALEASLQRARELDLAVGVVVADLDNFRLVNDSLGRDAGDALLVELAARLRGIVPEADFLACPGGDQFLLLVPDLADPETSVEDVEAVAGRVHEILHEPFAVLGVDVAITASVGISVFPGDSSDGKTLLGHADEAMYLSKRLDPGRTVVFSDDLDDPMERLQRAIQLRQWVEHQSWELHYQPVVDLADGHIDGVEALIRGRAENGDLIPPMEFIPLAEETGAIERIGDWVIDEVCRQVKEWNDMGLHLEVGFNVSPRQLRSARFAEDLLHRVDASGIDPHRIVVEITETTAARDAEKTGRILRSLHDAGFRIAIDDFGTGFSSLGRLKLLPVDVLKIDRSFVTGAHLDRDAGTMVQAMVQLARNLGMISLAEGVETTEELAFLRALACPLGQGFLFSRPVPAAGITDLLVGEISLLPPVAAA